ncbi:amidohydrolase family protein, partial [Corynebacterium argentoratense]
MSSTLFTGISELHTVSERGVINNGAVIIQDGTIQWVGPAAEAPAADQEIDCEGRAVLPGWVDSHTHMIFAGDRSQE